MNTIMYDTLVGTTTDYFYPFLKASEDLDSFADTIKREMRKLTCDTLATCIERFDDEVAEEVPRTWDTHSRPSRTIVTCLGHITYRRRLYRDNCERNRYPTDEILGIAPKARLSTDAFLWIAHRAAHVSFRKTADDFYTMSGVAISAMTVMRVIRRAANLIKLELEHDQPSPQLVSQHELFIEADGLYVAFQEPKRRKQAISRFLYEQTRTKKSFEMKCGCVYAGKVWENNKYVRKGTVLYATSGDASIFWSGMERAVSHQYEARDIEHIYYGSDGASWLKNHTLENLVGTRLRITHQLDLFHVMRSIRLAFGPGRVRTWMTKLILSGKTAHFIRSADKLIKRMDETKQAAALECRNYIANNAALIHKKRVSLGTMEATNAYVWAKRMKSFACSWSREGAEAMALVRSYVCAGKALIFPSKKVFFTEPEQEKHMKALSQRGQEAMRYDSSGKGWDPSCVSMPHVRAPGRYYQGLFSPIWVR